MFNIGQIILINIMLRVENANWNNILYNAFSSDTFYKILIK